MIHKHDDTFKFEEIYPFFINNLLNLFDLKKCPQAREILSTLLYSSVRRTSLHQASQALENVPTGKTVRNHLHLLFDSLDDAEKKLNELLRSLLPKRISKRARMTVAIDYHQDPFYGKIDENNKDEICRRNKQHGTHSFFTYATAMLCHDGVRYTLAFCRVKKGESTKEAVKKLVAYMRKAKIRPKLLLLDSEFYSSKTIRYLVKSKHPFIIPMPKTGRKDSEKGPATGAYRFFGSPKGWYRYTINKNQTAKSRTRTSINVALRYSYQTIKGGGRERKMLLYATWGVGKRSVDWVLHQYKRRFGIEASYRQKNQAKIRTSTKNPTLRLLFFFIATFVRQIWVSLHDEVFSTPRQGQRIINFEYLILESMLDLFARAIEDEYVFCSIRSGPPGVNERLKGFFQEREKWP